MSQNNLEQKAFKYASVKHKDQKRKYTLDPYIFHPVAVSILVSRYTDDIDTICAALLHDVIEDCGVTYFQLAEEFNSSIASMVYDLSNVDLSFGNRKTRKEIDRNRLQKSCYEVQLIKLCDIINNMESISKYDKKFFQVFLMEAKELAKVLDKAPLELRKYIIDFDITSSIMKFYDDLISNQQHLGYDFQKILYENLWDLYESH